MLKHLDLSDSELLLNAISDKSYLSELSNRYHRSLSKFVRRFVRDKETSEDIVQETFLRCMRYSHKYPDIKKVSNWLFTISANLAKTELRRRKRWNSFSISTSKDREKGIAFEPVSNRPQPDTQISKEQIKLIVRKSINQLPQKFRRVVLLRDIYGCSYEEISKIFGVPIGTVKSRVNRGRSRLQEPLKKLAKEIYDSN